MKFTLANFWLVFGGLCGFWCVYGTLITGWYSMLSDKAAWAQVQLLCALVLFPLSIVALVIVFVIGRLQTYCSNQVESTSFNSDNVSNV